MIGGKGEEKVALSLFGFIEKGDGKPSPLD
jgi:hypothetical protein